MKKWSSHHVESPSNIVHTGSFPIGGHCTSVLVRTAANN